MSDSESTPYENNLFSNHFLENRVQDLEEWQEAEIEEKYEKFSEKARENTEEKSQEKQLEKFEGLMEDVKK